MKTAQQYLLTSVLLTLPVTLPYTLQGVYHEYRIDLYVELCIERLINDVTPIYCDLNPSYIPKGIAAVVVLSTVFSIPFLPITFPIAYIGAKFWDSWRSLRAFGTPHEGLGQRPLGRAKSPTSTKSSVPDSSDILR